MASTTDSAVAETQRVLDEYLEAREPVVGNPDPDPFAKARFDRAQAALRDHRRTWRQIGQYVGDRPVSDDPTVDNDTVAGIRTIDNETALPALLEG